MTTKTAPSVPALVEKAAREAIDTGATPRAVAETYMARHAADLPEDALLELATYGFMAHLNEERERMRRAPIARTPSRRVAGESEIRMVHAETRCTFKTHAQNVDKMHDCVFHILVADEADRAELIAKRITSNVEADADQRAIQTRYEDGLTRAIRDHRRQVQRELLESINLVGADGTTKTLAGFTLDDLALWRERSKTQVASWSEREAWFRDARSALMTRGGGTLGDLEVDELETIVDRAREIWKSR